MMTAGLDAVRACLVKIYDPASVDQQTEMNIQMCLCLEFGRRIDEDAFREVYGQGGSDQFWKNTLFGIQEIDAFVKNIALAGADDALSAVTSMRLLAKAMIEAHLSDERWFRGGIELLAGAKEFTIIENPYQIKVVSRPAVEWLLLHPRWNALVPESLKSYLLPKQNVSSSPTAIVRGSADSPSDIVNSSSELQDDRPRWNKASSEEWFRKRIEAHPPENRWHSIDADLAAAKRDHAATSRVTRNYMDLLRKQFVQHRIRPGPGAGK